MNPERPADPARKRPRTPQEERDALLAYAFRALGGRALTEAELRAKLQRRTEDPQLMAEVLARVRDLGYQDDAHVARVEGARRSVGTFRVRQTLKRRGINEELIQETLDARDPEAELDAARELLLRRWPSLARKRDPRASAYAFLARRGFPGRAIWAAIREVAAEFPPTDPDDAGDLNDMGAVDDTDEPPHPDHEE